MLKKESQADDMQAINGERREGDMVRGTHMFRIIATYR